MKMMKLCIAFVTTAVLGASPAAAATYYVATNGNDGASGASDRPFRTMVKGIGVMRPGDTLLVQPGVYEENLNFKIPSGTSWSAAITIKAANPQSRPVLRTPGANWVLYLSNQQYIIVDGFVLDGTNVAADGLKLTTGSHHIRVQNSEIRNAPSQGVLTTDGATQNELLNLDIHDNGRRDLDHGIYLSSPGNLVSNCRIYRNAGWGVHVYSGNPDSGNNVIRNNLVYDNARVGARGDGILLSSGPGNTAYNNIVRGNQVGIWVGYGATNNSVYHNTVYGNRGEFGIFIGSDSSGTIVRNNISFGNATSRAVENRGVGSVVSHNLTSDPRFVSAASGDFRLLADSPAIDAGLSIASVSVDFRGQSRAAGAAPDLGAYEADRPPSTPTNVRVVPGS